MYKRSMSATVKDAATGYPVVTLLGPRQSGKSTLARQCFPDKPYVSLENPDTLDRVQGDPRGFLDALDNGAVIDEVQRMPQMLSYLQGVVDERPRPGQFILTGSHQTALKSSIGQSLAGRTAVLKLLPLSYAELAPAKPDFELWREVLKGAFPRPRQAELAHGLFYASYLQTFLERDLRSSLEVRDNNQFRDFMRLLAGRVGQVINFTSLASDLGASPNTLRQWLAALEASYLVFQLPPYYENFRERVIKSPKVYFTDTGLACALMGIETAAQLSRDPAAGGLVENWAILDYMKSRWNRGLEANIYFFRDSHGSEVDLLIKRGHQLIPVEVKSAQTWSRHFLKGIKRLREAGGERVQPGFVVFNGADRGTTQGTRIMGFEQVGALEDMLA